MQLKNECSSPIYVKSVGKQLAINETFTSEETNEIRTLIKENKLSIVKDVQRKKISKPEQVYEEDKMSIKEEENFKTFKKNKKYNKEDE